MSFFNYFTDAERGQVQRAIELKNRAFAAVCPVLLRLRIHPDTLSYVGLALLLGVVIWFVSHPYRALFLLALYVVLDGLDGSYARYLNRPTQSGAFTDMVADQLGMVVVALGFIQYRMVDGVVGAYYIMIYLTMIVMSVVQNAHHLPMQYIFRSKYLLYGFYMLWAFTGVNLAPVFLPAFCLIMTVSVVQSYQRLKRGFYWRYDLPKILAQEKELRARGETPPRFSLVMKLLLPALTAGALLFMAGYTQIVSMLERADHRPRWSLSPELPLLDPRERPRAVAAYREGWLVSTYHPNTHFSRVYYLESPAGGGERADELRPAGSFRVPWALHPDHGLCVDEGRLFIADRLSRRVFDVLIEPSLARGTATLDRSFDSSLRAPVSCALVEVEGQKRMLISEYMNNYKTIMVDHEAAFELGSAEPALLGWYRNGGFSRGLAADRGAVLEINSSLWKDLIYLIDLNDALDNHYLRTGIQVKIASPRWRCRDLALKGERIALVDGKRPFLYLAELPDRR